MGCAPRQDPRPRLAGDGLQLRRRLCLECHNRRRRRGSLAGRDFRPRLACRRRTGARDQFDYYPFRMKDSLPVVKRAVAAVSGIGGTPTIRAANGGLDANWMVRHGVPTVTFGAGQNEPHTIDEWINLDEYDRACALAVQLATMQ